VAGARVASAAGRVPFSQESMLFRHRTKDSHPTLRLDPRPSHHPGHDPWQEGGLPVSRHWPARRRERSRAAHAGRSCVACQSLSVSLSRQDGGRRSARPGDWKMGRKPKLTPHQQREAIKRRDAGEPMQDIALTYNVSHSTISRLP
jgi:Helix-turn-helix domain of resolvase